MIEREALRWDAFAIYQILRSWTWHATTWKRTSILFHLSSSPFSSSSLLLSSPLLLYISTFSEFIRSPRFFSSFTVFFFNHVCSALLLLTLPSQRYTTPPFSHSVPAVIAFLQPRGGVNLSLTHSLTYLLHVMCTGIPIMHAHTRAVPLEFLFCGSYVAWLDGGLCSNLELAAQYLVVGLVSGYFSLLCSPIVIGKIRVSRVPA